MNSIVISGRLTSKAELRYTHANIPVTKFTVAVNRPFKDNDGKQQTDFINCVVWRKQAENVCNYLDKGSKVLIDGSLQTSTYTDKDGKKGHTTEINVRNIEFLDSKKKEETQETSGKTDMSVYEDFGDIISTDSDFLD